MSTERFKDYLRGFLVPYPFTSADISYGTGIEFSNFTTYNPVADTPIPDRDTDLFVGATGGGSMLTDLQIKTNKAGSAATAEYLVKDNLAPSFNNFGSQQNSFITAWENLKAYSSAFIYYLQPNIISDDDGGYIAVYTYRQSSLYSVRATRVDALGNTTDSFITFTNSTVNNGFPCLCRLDDGSFLCIVINRPAGSDYANADVYRSTDGLSFSLASRSVLDIGVNVSTGNYSIRRVSVAALHGQILLVISASTASGAYTKKNHLLQYASVDGGGNFKKVTLESELDTASFRACCVYTTLNELAICYVGATDELHNILMPHAFFSAYSLRAAGKYTIINGSVGSANDFAAGSDDNMTSGYISGCTNPDGTFQIFALDVSDNALLPFYSDNGRDWYGLFTNSSPSTEPSTFFIDNAAVLNEFNVIPHYGGCILCHNWTTSSSGFSVGIMYLGGFSNFTNPYRTDTQIVNSLNRVACTYTWLPMLLPSLSSPLTKTGTGTETLLSDYARLLVSSGQNDILYTRTGSTYTNKKGVVVYGTAVCIEDKSDTVYFKTEIQVENVGFGNYFKILLKIYEDNLIVTDISGLSPITLYQSSIGANTPIDFILSIYEGKACFYWRNNTLGSLYAFTEAFKNVSLSVYLTGTVDQNRVIFGLDGSAVSSSPAAEAHLYKLCVSDAAGVDNITNIDNADDLIGKRFSTIKPQYIAEGVGIFAQGGTSYIGDEWRIKSTSINSIDNIFYDVSPSPRVQWFSEEVSPLGIIPTQKIVYELASAASSFGNDLIGLHLANINFDRVRLNYWNGSSWVTLYDMQTSTGMKHNFVRQGKSIKQATPASYDESYYFHNELKGYIAKITNLAGTLSQYFTVVSNTEGAFGEGQGKICIVILDGIPSFDGIVYFIPKNITAVVSLNGVVANKWAIEIFAQTALYDQYRIGNIFLGAVAITGTQYSKGRKIALEAGAITEITPDRTRYSKVFSPEQRTVSISWSDGVDISAFYDNNPDPDYFKASSTAGAEPIAAYNDVPYLLEGIFRELQGDNKPLVYLPSIATDQDNRIYNRRGQQMLAVIDGDLNVESITGEELIGNGKGEVMRVGTLNLVEIV